MDGKGFRPDGKTAATLIPPAFGLAGVNLHTFTGWGSIPYWNAFVATLEMHGQGTFFDPRLDDAARFPVAARNRFGHVHAGDDRVTPALPALHAYQLSLAAPRPAEGSFDAAAARRGQAVFTGRGQCASCHVPPLYTEGGWNLHRPEEVGVDSFQADRSPTGGYRTTPLRGLFAHSRRGFYHDGRFATLSEVVDHYDALLGLGLSPAEKAELVEYLKSL
jgi:cytochrome c peroxidase